MKELRGEELVLLAATFSVNIAKDTDTDELQVLSDFLAMVAASILAIVDKRNIEKNSSTNSVGNTSNGNGNLSGTNYWPK